MQELNHTNNMVSLSEIFKYSNDVSYEPDDEWLEEEQFVDSLWAIGLVLSYGENIPTSMIAKVYDFDNIEKLLMEKSVGSLNKLFPNIMYFNNDGVLMLDKYIGELSRCSKGIIRMGKVYKDKDGIMPTIILMALRIKLGYITINMPDMNKIGGNFDFAYQMVFKHYNSSNIKLSLEVFSIRILRELIRSIEVVGDIKTAERLKLKLMLSLAIM